MPSKDTLTIALEGEITLRVFAYTLDSLQNLLNALSNEVAANAEIRWVVSGLEYGSATATLRGVERDAHQAPVTRVIEAYEDVGLALQSGARPPARLGKTVALRASQLGKQVLSSDVTLLRMETQDYDAILRPEWLSTLGEDGVVSDLDKAGSPAPLPERLPWAYGSIRGRVQAATSRGGLRFTLYESLKGRAVSCYLAEGQDDLITSNWGKLVFVVGRVTRDPETGRPLAIRRITEIREVPDSSPGAWRNAREVSGWREGDVLAEDAIRESRDGLTSKRFIGIPASS